MNLGKKSKKGIKKHNKKRRKKETTFSFSDAAEEDEHGARLFKVGSIRYIRHSVFGYLLPPFEKNNGLRISAF